MDKTVLEGCTAPAIEYINGLETHIGGLEDKIDKLQVRLDQLTELLIAAQKSRFGQSSEKARYILEGGYEQETLFNEAEIYANEDEPEPVIVGQHARKAKRTKEELAKDLPVREVIIDIPEDKRVCAICETETMVAIGKELVRRELCVIPEQVYVEELYTINYGCTKCMDESDEANIVKPEVPEPVVKRGLASPSSAAHVMYQKYVNAMPLYRQSKNWENFGVQVSRATMANWIIYTSLRWLLPMWKALKVLLLEAPVKHGDETTIQCLKEPGKKPQSDSYMWAYCTGKYAGTPPIVLFEYQSSRSGGNPKAFLEGAKDYYLTTDGYAGYNSVVGAVHTGCWAHYMSRLYIRAEMPQAFSLRHSA